MIFLTRFMPGLRLPTYFAAGVVRTSLPVFAFWFVLAGMLWTPALVGIAAWVGHEAQDSLDLFGEYALWGVLGLLGLLVLLKRVVVPLLTWRGRRLLWGRLQRVWRGVQARRRVKALRQADDLLEQEVAAIFIQKTVRGMAVRKAQQSGQQ